MLGGCNIVVKCLSIVAKGIYYTQTIDYCRLVILLELEFVPNTDIDQRVFKVIAAVGFDRGQLID